MSAAHVDTRSRANIAPGFSPDSTLHPPPGGNTKEDGENPLKACMEEADIFYQLLEAHPEDLMQIRTPEDIRALEKDGRIGAMLTMEEGASCLDDIRILRDLYRLGVRMMTFTWNYENGLAWPNHVPEKDEDPCSPVTDKGMKEKGLEFLAEMERLHMIADVSHLGDSGIMDMLRYAKRPFAASHSNARALCGHVRNLTDEMIRGMGEKGCIAGLNYCPMFVDPSYGGQQKCHCMLCDSVGRVCRNVGCVYLAVSVFKIDVVISRAT